MKLARPLLLSVLDDALLSRARDKAAWLDAIARTAADVDDFARTFGQASRHAGRSAVALSADEVSQLRELGVTWPLARWAVDDLARTAVLLRAAEVLGPRGLEALLHRAYADGDTRERQAILRALPVLPCPERFLGVAVDAERSGVPPLFEAIACENPYPAAHFPVLNFNHMVLEALVTGVSLDRIVGLPARVTPALVRLANDYAAERRAAGRLVPADVDYITAATRMAAA